MSRAYIVRDAWSEDGSRVPIHDVIVIGRTPDCDVIIDDAAASRHHMEIAAREGVYVWRDLNSTNGVLVNGERLHEGALQDGDTIRIGGTELLFQIDDTVEPSAEPETRIFRKTVLDAEGHLHEEKDRSQAEELLEAVHQVMNDIGANYDRCGLVDRVLETTIKAIHAQRGAILFSDPETGTLAPCPVCRRVHVIEDGVLQHTDRHEIQLSETVVERVLTGGESVLIRDTSGDQELSSSESVLALNLKSIICAPVRGKYGVFGILYIDTDDPGDSYTNDHLVLSTAVGNSAGLALENAQLHQEILERQRVDQEIEYAAIIQESFLAKKWPVEDRRFEVYGEARPAKRIGGDFYDFVQPDERYAGLLIGDVSGKGVPAALAMAQLLAEFRARPQLWSEPDRMVREMNRVFAEKSRRGMFCTLCYVFVDTKMGSFRAVSAGHHPLLIAGRDGVRELDAGGPPAGVLDDCEWEASEGQLDRGEVLLLYTDGIVEARTGGETARGRPEYGRESVKRVLTQTRNERVDSVIQTLLEDVRQFCEPATPHDDCTAVAFRLLES